MNTTLSPSRSRPDQEMVSPLVRPIPRAANSDYAELKRLLKDRGLLDKQPVYYLWRIALLLALLAGGLVFLLGINILWLQLLDAAYLALVFGQIGLLSHEAGHHQMFHRTSKHAIVGLVGGNLLIGMSYAWWQEKHNRHHSHPNQVGMDPDIEIPFLDFTGTARNKLKQAQPIVKAFCLAHALPYHETSVSQSFTEIFRHLHHIGAPLRR